jgi:hypothetical protein
MTDAMVCPDCGYGGIFECDDGWWSCFCGHRWNVLDGRTGRPADPKPSWRYDVRNGWQPVEPYVGDQAAERAAVVAWLRRRSVDIDRDMGPSEALFEMAELIEKGEHRG